MVAALLISTSAIGAGALALFYLFLDYPAEQTNWDNLLFRLQLIIGLSAAGFATGIVLEIGRRTRGQKLKRIILLTIAIVAIATFQMFRNVSTEQNDATSSAALSNRYEFSSDWVTQFVRSWEIVLAPVKGKPQVKALEIGSYEGRSALWFVTNVLTHATSSIVCVDIFPNPEIEARFDKNIAVSGLSNKVTKLKGRSDDILRQLKPAVYDFIYIDGSHIAKDVLVDAVLSWELLKPGGIVIFDDYQWSGDPKRLGRHKKPKLAIDAFLDVYAPYAEVIHDGYQLSLRKKATMNLDDEGAIGRFARRLQLLLD